MDDHKFLSSNMTEIGECKVQAIILGFYAKQLFVLDAI